MELSFEIDNITDKEADDAAERILMFIMEELEHEVSEYWIQIGDGQ